MAANIRLDKGTETGKLTTIQCFLRAIINDNGDDDHEEFDPSDSVIYGPSTSNQVR